MRLKQTDVLQFSYLRLVVMNAVAFDQLISECNCLCVKNIFMFIVYKKM